MRRLHIVNVCFVGRFGLADYTLSLARALAAHCRSTIVTALDFDYPHVPFDGEVVRLFRRSRHYPLDVLRFLRWAWQTQPDVIVFQAPLKLPLVDALIARVLRLRGIRMATTVHDVLPHYPKAWSPWIYRYFYRSFERLVAHSQAAERRLRSMGIEAPVLVVPHGVYDIYRVRGASQVEARARLPGLATQDFVLLFFGLVDERKGIEPLVDFGLALAPDNDVRIVIAGANGIDPANEHLHDKLRLAKTKSQFIVRDNAIPFDDVEDLFAACDAVVLPYLEGTTSGVLKLAMAFERPVVASDIGDIPENVPSNAGVVFPHTSVAASLPAAVARMRNGYDGYRRRWRATTARYAWPEIGRRYHEFLAHGLQRED